MINVGDIVTPKSKRLWLADVPVNGEYNQSRKSVCVFEGTGKVLQIEDCIIDYDEWDKLDDLERESFDLGKVEFRNCLIECTAGIGWAGSGALEHFGVE